MKILLRLPTWLGDAVMTTPTIQSLRAHFPQASFTLVGSPASVGIFENQTYNDRLMIDTSKTSKNRFLSLERLAKQIGKHDISITFQNNFPSAFLLYRSQTPRRIGYAKNFRSLLLTDAITPSPSLHQVDQYLNLLSPLHIPIPKNPQLHLDCTPTPKGEKIRIGINAGAKYGSAKRWCEEYFIQVMIALLSKGYEVFLYGGQDEISANARIANAIKSQTSTQNFFNLTAQTTIPQLINSIASLDLFLTNDSGPMHIASSLHIPIVAIFGPTDSQETSPYNRQSGQILLNKHLPCSPCKKRECPLKHHQCMTLITPLEVLGAIEKLLRFPKKLEKNND